MNPMTTALRRLAWPAAAAGLFVLLPHEVPLYDGIGFPDEPYRYVQPPPGTRPTAPPTSGRETFPLKHGTNRDEGCVMTDEIGPQATICFASQGISAAASAPRVDVDLVPIPMTTRDLPGNGSVDSNLYRLDVVVPGSTAKLGVDEFGSRLTLRSAASRSDLAIIDFRTGAGAPWTAQGTYLQGQDTYWATAPAAGQYVLVHPRGASGGTSRAGGGNRGVALVALSVFALAAILAGVRFASGRR